VRQLQRYEYSARINLLTLAIDETLETPPRGLVRVGWQAPFELSAHFHNLKFDYASARQLQLIHHKTKVLAGLGESLKDFFLRGSEL